MADSNTRIFVPMALKGGAEPKQVLPAIQRLLEKARRFQDISYGVIDKDGNVLVSGTLMAATPGVSTAIIGRHSHADGRADEGDFPLRHLLLVHRAATPHTVRVFDLLSGGGTSTLADEPITTADVSVPTVLRVGQHLLIIATQDAKLDAAAIVAQAATTPVPALPATSEAGAFDFALTTTAEAAVPSTHKTQMVARPLKPRAIAQRMQFRPTTGALGNGVLIGRYERCAAPATMTWDPTLSRVHALLFAFGADAYVTDLGSTNGVHGPQGALRLKQLAKGDKLQLGQTQLEVR